MKSSVMSDREDRNSSKRSLVRSLGFGIGLGFAGLVGVALLLARGRGGYTHTVGGARVRTGSTRERNQDLDNRVKQMLRSKRVIANPGAITVQVRDDVVMLSGPIFRSEVEFLLETVRSIDGVGDVIDRLDVHDTAEKVSGLQGRPFPMG